MSIRKTAKVCHNCFRILSDKNRLIIITLLRGRERKVSDLAKKFEIGQPTISYHLSKLRRHKIVKVKKKGRQVFYSLNKNHTCKNCKIFDALKS